MKTFSFISAVLLLAAAPTAMATPAAGLEDASPLLEVRWMSPKNKCTPTKTSTCITGFKRDIEALSVGGPQVLQTRAIGIKCTPRKGYSCLMRKDEGPQVLEAQVMRRGNTCSPSSETVCVATRDLQGLVVGGRAVLEMRGVKSPSFGERAKWTCRPTENTSCLHKKDLEALAAGGRAVL
ncbi:hypothetical protein GGTG_03863 [Gaeumannomyces tritici R3-111a-1]|uniref:Secreted protein n=1 Tax=Gaeumannomyces tritici (strain R3-111a-1) TaxID=644352 RepID=J3NRF9_GAET3|nr:hypothetical protein GGTG_03863 [Gaeumannomyces tritici R3-111a-1]EJT78765.1 hypothetical protein GGTG_03863 [Gaeumannomyces tritici R3-111a-1]